MNGIIEPRVLKGFRDFLPADESVRRLMSERIEAGFRSFGFVPIDTPALEYAEILLGKGGGETEKQIYRFNDHGGRDVALRFDLTVPFARFVAQHYGELHFPLKRYHIGKVWRGENAQRGRFREFTQCDFDIIGSESPAADLEILLMIGHALRSVGAGPVSIRVNHRGLFNRFLARIGRTEAAPQILRIVDKAAKVGEERTGEDLSALVGEADARRILAFTGTAGRESFGETLARLRELAGGDSPEAERLALIKGFMDNADPASAELLVLDPSITRGLDYYTGIVFETFLADLPSIGSICSGGRYDDLAGLYSKNRISGVGSSVGLDRLIAALQALDRLPAETGAAVLAIACLDPADSGRYQALARNFRERGISCEVFTEQAEPVKQFVLAEKKGIRWMLIPERPLGKSFTLRDLASRENRPGVDFEGAASILRGTQDRG
ncbi:MAG: histidine--tRNA ligase [Treponema sp.]|nr:histidine--tRNA ligase [Treponema sp.]